MHWTTTTLATLMMITFSSVATAQSSNPTQRVTKGVRLSAPISTSESFGQSHKVTRAVRLTKSRPKSAARRRADPKQSSSGHSRVHSSSPFQAGGDQAGGDQTVNIATLKRDVEKIKQLEERSQRHKVELQQFAEENGLEIEIDEQQPLFGPKRKKSSGSASGKNTTTGGQLERLLSGQTGAGPTALLQTLQKLLE